MRRANVDDIDAVLAVAASSSLASHWAGERYLQMLTCPPDAAVQAALLVGEVAGAVVGFAAASAIVTIDPPETELENLAVLPSAQRCGVGSELLGAVLDWAVALGAGAVRLEVRSGNGAAIALYRRCGFVETGVRKGYYAAPVDDAVCMERPAP